MQDPGAVAVAGPASAVSIPWLRGERMRPGDTGTGLAIPKARPVVKTITAGRIIVQNGSMCLNGLRVRRPASWAVGGAANTGTAPPGTAGKTLAPLRDISSHAIGVTRAIAALHAGAGPLAPTRLAKEVSTASQPATPASPAGAERLPVRPTEPKVKSNLSGIRERVNSSQTVLKRQFKGAC